MESNKREWKVKESAPGSSPWWEIKLPWSLLVARPIVDPGWDYRVQLYGPSSPISLGGGRLFPTIEAAKEACVTEAKALLASELRMIGILPWDSDSRFHYDGKGPVSVYESTSRIARSIVARAARRTWFYQVHFYGPDRIEPLGLDAGFASESDAKKAAVEAMRDFIIAQIDALPGDLADIFIPKDSAVRVIVSEQKSWA